MLYFIGQIFQITAAVILAWVFLTGLIELLIDFKNIDKIGILMIILCIVYCMLSIYYTLK